PRIERGGRAPYGQEPGLQLACRSREIGEKLAMISLKSIIRLADRHQQVVIDQFRIECVQDGSVMKKKSAFALLGIAGDFSARQAQIARAGQLNSRLLTPDPWLLTPDSRPLTLDP